MVAKLTWFFSQQQLVQKLTTLPYMNILQLALLLHLSLHCARLIPVKNSASLPLKSVLYSTRLNLEPETPVQPVVVQDEDQGAEGHKERGACCM